MNRASLWIPLVVFVLMAFFLWRGFSLEDAHDLPSALIDRPLPTFELAILNAPERKARTEDLLGEPFLLNVWATWCPTCRAEHAELERIAERYDMTIVGVNYKDDPVEARLWLQRYGDPYRLSVMDQDGSLGIDLGVYGAPETFVVDGAGMIRYKRVGAIDRRVWEREIVPVLRELEGTPEPVLALAREGAS
ncbi:MAG TPA: DsbE family thiol:disulfide interchange protein [Pseudomonadales bacterium]|nr:DsbE family thiol:disulfide interchange protein [Pseudomonadales bacterium]